MINADVEKAFDYRGDVTVTRKDGTRVEGYMFDRQTDAFVRLMLKEDGRKISIPYEDIDGVEFTGRDTAAGKSWEAWVKKYMEKKAAGETNIGLHPDERE